MPKKIVYCELCDIEYNVTYKGKHIPGYCPFCGENVDLDWNSDEGEENE